MTGARSAAADGDRAPRRRATGERRRSGDVEVASFEDAWDAQAQAEFGDLGPAEAGRRGGGDRGGGAGAAVAAARRPALAGARDRGRRSSRDRQASMTAPMVDDASGIRTTRLDSGLRVVTERLPEPALGRGRVLGRAPGRATSRTRSPAPATSSSTCCSRAPTTRHARGDRRGGRAVGGDMNAFTAKEYTAFYVRLPDRDLDLGARHPLRHRVVARRSAPDEVESERQVILEEIRMHDDTPDDLVHDAVRRARCSPTTRSAARSLGTPGHASAR